MTRVLWDSLPVQYRLADAEQTPTPYPLRRWLEGVGGIMTRVRGYADLAEQGVLADPENAPENVLPWLAQMAGLEHRGQTVQHLRQVLLSRVSAGAPLVGTRSHIGDAAMRVLGADAPLAVYPHPEEPWVIIVATDAVSIEAAGGAQAVYRALTRYAAVPAGYAIMPIEARVDWQTFDAAKPPTWAEFTRDLPTWADVDSVGVAFTDD